MNKILLVEDNIHLLQLYELLFISYDVTSARDAEKAFQSLEFNTFNLVILDLHLPTISGLEILQHIRQFPRHEQVAVFVVSADDKLKHRVQEIGIQLWMTKPIEIKDLILAVRQCIG